MITSLVQSIFSNCAYTHIKLVLVSVIIDIYLLNLFRKMRLQPVIHCERNETIFYGILRTFKITLFRLRH